MLIILGGREGARAVPIVGRPLNEPSIPPRRTDHPIAGFEAKHFFAADPERRAEIHEPLPRDIPEGRPSALAESPDAAADSE